MKFVRIVSAGYDINGNCKYRVYLYKWIKWTLNEYNYASIDELKKLDFGRINKNGHFITTKLYKHEILEKLEKEYGDNFAYIFE